VRLGRSQPSPAREALLGAVAGAAGTTALDIVTYLDMAIRNRPPSQVPEDAVEKLAQGAGVSSLGEGRKAGLGALLGYAAGLSIGTAYGAVRSRVRWSPPLPVAGVVLGLGAMAATDTPIIGLGLSDPREWGVSGFLSDIVPHVVYGLVTAGAYEALTDTA
jgi:hypothetical protein